MIRIKAYRDGFRRCGVSHPKAPTEHPDGTFSDAEIETLEAEPMLDVEVVPEREMTVQDIKDLLDEMQVDYPPRTNKGDLQALLDAAKAERGLGA